MLVPGRLTYVSGPMYARKTTMLSMVVERSCALGRKTLAFVFDKGDDVPLAELKRSHDGIAIDRGEAEGRADVVLCTEVDVARARHYDTVVVDEVQFFLIAGGAVLVAQLRALAHDTAHARTVVAGGLNEDYRGRVFNRGIEVLMLSCDAELSISAACRVCGKSAMHSQLVRSSATADDADATDNFKPHDTYYPACDEHHVPRAIDAVPPRE